MKAIAIIQDEHRAITAVIEGLRHLVAEIAAGRMAADLRCWLQCSTTSRQFPERLHHPKEDDFLFARLRLRRPDAASLLDGLQREHAIGRERFDELKAMLGNVIVPTLPRCHRSPKRVERYSQFHWLHMRKEEDEVLPLAADGARRRRTGTRSTPRLRRTRIRWSASGEPRRSASCSATSCRSCRRRSAWVRSRRAQCGPVIAGPRPGGRNACAPRSPSSAPAPPACSSASCCTAPASTTSSSSAHAGEYVLGPHPRRRARAGRGRHARRSRRRRAPARRRARARAASRSRGPASATAST